MLQFQEQSPTLFFADISNIVGDEAALKRIWDSKGSSGLVPCFCCGNCTTVSSKLVENDDAGYLVDISCCVFLNFDKITNQHVYEKVELLSRDDLMSVMRGVLLETLDFQTSVDDTSNTSTNASEDSQTISPNSIHKKPQILKQRITVLSKIILSCTLPIFYVV